MSSIHDTLVSSFDGDGASAGFRLWSNDLGETDEYVRFLLVGQVAQTPLAVTVDLVARLGQPCGVRLARAPILFASLPPGAFARPGLTSSLPGGIAFGLPLPAAHRVRVRATNLLCPWVHPFA